MMYKIQANASGTRYIEVSNTHFETLQNMKAFGLKNLVDLYKQWNKKQESLEQSEEELTEESSL